MITAGTSFGSDIETPDVPHPDPIALMLMWLPRDVDLLPLAALSTIGRDGYPDVRHVLVSDQDADGILIHTDTTSRKAHELAAQPRAALAVAWPEIGRQLIARGDIDALDPDEAAPAYRRRSRYLQLLAWLNTPETALLPQSEKQTEWARFDAEHPVLDPPATWGGFRLRPAELIFWRGDPAGPSTRHFYSRSADGWECRILPG